MAKTAVVILNYNGRQFLEKFLPGVIQHSRGTDIYVADNKSTDGSIEFLCKEFPEIYQVQLDSNYGYASGYNAALKQIDAEYYILLNSDIDVTKNWIDPIISFMDLNADVVACQPKILDFNNKQYFEYAGAAGGFLDVLGYPYCRGRIFDALEEDRGQYNNNKQVFWASGACLFIRSDIFHKLDGFDEGFFAHMEEVDLCWRINLLGKKVYCIPESKVYHIGGGTLSKTNPQKTYLNFRNNLTMLYKNSPGRSLIWKLPLRASIDMLAGLKFWKDNSFGHLWVVVKAYFNFLANISNNNKKRYRIKRLRKNTIALTLTQIVLPFQYYLLNKKTYDKLND